MYFEDPDTVLVSTPMLSTIFDIIYGLWEGGFLATSLIFTMCVYPTILDVN